MSFPFAYRNSALADSLYSEICNLPIVSPHGHVPIEVMRRDQQIETTPSQLFITDDHYVVRMLYSLGVMPSDIGLSSRSERTADGVYAAEKTWEIFWSYRNAFEGTPSGYWISRSISDV